MFNVSMQAQVFGILLVSMVIIICTAIIATRGYIGILYALSVFISSMPFILTGMYMMDCLSYGECDMFAWIIIIAIFIIFTSGLIWVSIVYLETRSLVDGLRRNIQKEQPLGPVQPMNEVVDFPSSKPMLIQDDQEDNQKE
jgi:hypothetical protein